MAAVSELMLGASASAWQKVGLTVEDQTARVGAVTLRFAPHERGLARWGLAGLPPASRTVTGIDGLPTTEAPAPSGPAPDNEMGATRLELITVATTSLLRTADAIEAVTGDPLTSVRRSGDFSVGFIRLGEVLAEIAQSSRASGDHAVFGGFVIVVEQLEQLTERLGPDVISEPRIAVQYGRHIATFRTSAGLGTPVAVMTPPPPQPPAPEQEREWTAMRLAARNGH
jgi:hypothetical protein